MKHSAMPRDLSDRDDDDGNERLFALVLADPSFRLAVAALAEAALQRLLDADAAVSEDLDQQHMSGRDQ